ncbi:GNAT family N-acetyltransferase [Brevibacillus sp. SYP-B805]|uniref:GNAT family N-acetyltransferase n=1 Tax=Brevibacillus sp. SYP-B805 TaxID=1578199 RepID=UPI0013ED34D5|nr:GNAT family N-acetyltransferase [Brevibacillus sp. SYP-B805]NGQ95428.1 GNAT family N-acetyltransferase [Brevibacillus sp. SYP-B805]
MNPMPKTYEIRQVQTDQEKRDALSVRRTVFIEEQQVPEELEIDEHDEAGTPTLHFVAYAGDIPVAAGRLRPYAPGVGKVERVAVLSGERGTGLGRLIMQEMEEAARQNGYRKLKLNAQCHARRFYEKLGYAPIGDVFEEAGIPHISMEKPLS